MGGVGKEAASGRDLETPRGRSVYRCHGLFAPPAPASGQAEFETLDRPLPIERRTTGRPGASDHRDPWRGGSSS